MTPDVADFASAETFPGTLTFGVFIRRFIPQLIVTGLLTYVLAGALLHGLGAGGHTRPVAAVLAVGLFVTLVSVKKRRFDATWGTAALELSPAGATIVSRYARVHVPWDRMRFLGKADLLAATRTPRWVALNVAVVFALMSATARRRAQAALIGRGTTTIAPDTPAQVRGQIRANDGSRYIDPATGQRLIAIVLPVFDENWQRGRIGEWIKAYRPDILPWV
jgi:hypothetical protein